ncbi:MAG: ComF family protein [Bacteroidaceae bacterium]
MSWWTSASDLLFPRVCSICGTRLIGCEKHLCAACTLSLPYTSFKGVAGNPIERMFWGKLPLVHASAYLYYHVGASSRNILFDLKYNNRPAVGYAMGQAMAIELKQTHFFDGIDVILPIPLAKSRLRHRGYNQDDWIANGIASITGIKVERNAVIRTKSNQTQTHLTHLERMENVEGIFEVKKPASLSGKHILLLDDVVTTGSTLASCGKEIAKLEGVRISVLALAASVHVGRKIM